MSTLTVLRGPVTTVTLNRPEVRNAFNDELIAELTSWATQVPADGSVRVVVLRGAGPVFCAGADLNWISSKAGYSREDNLTDVRRAALMFHALDALPVPVVARVQGAALGGGVGLAAVCDVVVAAEHAVFGLTEVRLGLIPATISPYVVRRIGFSAASELCLSGSRFSADRAREVGLVHEVVSEDQLDDAIERHVHAFLAGAPTAIAATKQLLRAVHGRRPSDVMAITVDALARQRDSPDGQEGVLAFLEDHVPAWAERAMESAGGTTGPKARRHAAKRRVRVEGGRRGKGRTR